jgi:hypothetical protein
LFRVQGSSGKEWCIGKLASKKLTTRIGHAEIAEIAEV